MEGIREREEMKRVMTVHMVLSSLLYIFKKNKKLICTPDDFWVSRWA